MRKTSFLCAAEKKAYPFILNLKEAFITVCLAGCFYLVITGAWSFAKNSLLLRREKISEETNAGMRYYDDMALSEIKDKKFWAGVKAIAGSAGLFLFIYKSTRDRKINSLTSNYKKSGKA